MQIQSNTFPVNLNNCGLVFRQHIYALQRQSKYFLNLVGGFLYTYSAGVNTDCRVVKHHYFFSLKMYGFKLNIKRRKNKQTCDWSNIIYVPFLPCPMTVSLVK